MTAQMVSPATLESTEGLHAASTLRDLLRVEQVRLVYDQLLTSQLVAVLNAVVFVAVQSLVIPAPVLVMWLAAVCVLALIRIAGGIAFRSEAPQAGQIGRWRIWAIVGATASGIVWGSAAWLQTIPQTSHIRSSSRSFSAGWWRAAWRRLRPCSRPFSCTPF